MEKLTVPQGAFQLARYPQRKNDPLRAWDAADEYLLHHLYEENLLDARTSILILNDLFGALSIALTDYRPQLISDSYLSHQGTRANLIRNDLSTGQVRLLNSLQDPDVTFDVVLIKIPRSLAFLEDQLHRLRACLHPATRIIGPSMVKGIHTSTLNLFERIFGSTHTSLARKKARLIFCQPTMETEPGTNPYPSRYTLEDTGDQIINHANVFSREKLDIGTRLLLEHLPGTPASNTIIDLGCGNGVVGLIAAARNPTAELIFIDESFMAVASAKANFQTVFEGHRKAQFHVTDNLNDLPTGSADLVLINPPFHQERGQGDQVALHMFRESKTVLKQRGELWIVANRHLGYHIQIDRLFGNCRTITGNRKFVILKAVKR